MAVFAGPVESLPDSPDLLGEWRVAGVTVHVTAATEIAHPERVEVGVLVTVMGQRQADQSVVARKIVVLPQPPSGTKERFFGEVESLPDTPGYLGEWVVSGRTVVVTEDTEIRPFDRPVDVGVQVMVHGTVAPDDSLTAELIVVMPDSQTPSPGPVDATVLVLHLEATAEAPDDAEGVALAAVFEFDNGHRSEDLKVAVKNLIPNHLHDVYIDGFHAGSILTDELGRGLLFLSSRGIPGALPLPDELRPVDELGALEVQNSEGFVVLFGDFADARRHDDPDPGRTYIALALLRDEFRQLKGQATAKATEDRQDLFLVAWRLEPDTEHVIIVDEQQLGIVFTDANGHFRVVYSTEPEGEAQPLPDEFLPVSSLLLIELRNREGDLVASGTLRALGRRSGPRPVTTRPVVPPRQGSGRSR